MKLQNLTVIFIIIVIPIILVLSLYISSGIKTIKYQSLYDDGLLSATHDAVYAYELNSANNDYSENPETKRSIIKSSVKMFEKSLANSCGISSYSSDEIEEYVPAVVFGMYDGFYMYAPSGLYDDTTGGLKDYAHNLKNFVYYSETIKNALGEDITITYSLDNYITVSGDFGSGYEVKKGYLMNLDDSLYTGDEYNDVKIVAEEIGGETNNEAIEYYKAAYRFTHWFLNNAKLRDKTIDGLKPFDISDTNDPENEKSAFVQHKRKVIKDKIESVLNSTITAYSNRTWGRSYKMPKLSQDDWQKIYNNMSVITFFQGKEIGLTNYNGYCVVNCTNSKEYVNPNLMYFTDDSGYYHSILCDKCKTYTISPTGKSKLNGYKIGSFEKKQVDTETTKKYEYEHDELACYDCINGAATSQKETVYEYITTTDKEDLKSVYWTSLGRERYDPTKITPIELTANISFDANEGIGQDKLEKYNVTYSEDNPSPYKYGEKIVFPITADKPTREGYEFKGWSTTRDGRNIVDPDTQTATINIVYFASWEKKKYDVTFDYNNTADGTGTYIEVQQLEFDSIINLLREPPVAAKKTGYRLIGWSTTRILREGTNADIITTEQRVKANNTQKFFGVWARDVFEIRFDYNYEGRGLIETREVIYNDFIDFPEIGEERIGFELIGWSKDPSATIGADAIRATESTTYYAIWKKKEYNIIFDYNDGTGEKLTKKFDHGATIVFPPRAKEGYNLIGWSTDRTKDNIVTNAIASGEKVYYAIWDPITYKIKYDGNGTTEISMPPSTHKYDQPKELSINTYKKKGYIFEGWSTVKNGAIVYTDGERVSNLTSVDGAEITLYAKWRAINYTIEYHGNGSTGGHTRTSGHKYDEPAPLTINGFTKTGYSFVGWATSASGEKVYDDGQTVVNLAYEENAVVHLYAKWEPIRYTVKYDGNGATSGSTPNSQHIYDQNKALSPNGYSRTGHTFIGWATSNNGAKVYNDKQSVKNLTTENGATVTLYAKWEKNTYNITYKRNYTDSDDNTLNLTPKTAKYEETVALPETSREGYTFKGWNTDKQATTGVKTFKVVNHVTLYAIWQVNIYQVAYNANGGSGSMEKSTHTYNVARPLNKNNYTKSGYSFAGWSETPGGTKKYNDQQSVVNLTTENGVIVNLYAVWIDNVKPTITNVIKNPSGWTNGNVTLTVEATDNGGSGVKEYSFDNGSTWQNSNKKTYSSNVDTINIVVKDNKGYKSDTYTTYIANIDKGIPGLEASFDSSTDKIKIKATDSLSGIDYYQVIYGGNVIHTTRVTDRYDGGKSPKYSKRSLTANVSVNDGGTYTVKVVDLAGNVKTVTVIVDKTVKFQNRKVEIIAKATGGKFVRWDGLAATGDVYLDLKVNINEILATNAKRYEIDIVHVRTGEVRASGELNSSTGSTTIKLTQRTVKGSIFIDYYVRIRAYNSLGEYEEKDKTVWISTTYSPIGNAVAEGIQLDKPAVVNVITTTVKVEY